MRSLRSHASLAALACTAAAILVLTPSPARAADASPDTFDLRIAAELRALNPAAEVPWIEANRLRDAELHQRAANGYRRVVNLAPAFYHAKRRLAMELLVLGERQAALDLLRGAYAAAETPENLTALARALVYTDRAYPDVLALTDPVTQAEAGEALALASRALEIRPDDPMALGALCMAALRVRDHARLRAAAERLVVVEPISLASHVYLAFSCSIDGRWEDARAEIERAHALGLPDAEYQKWLAELPRGGQLGGERATEARPHLTTRHFAAIAEWLLITWLTGLLLLLAVGSLLSWATLRRAEELPATPAGAVTGIDAFLRRIYRSVLWLSCLYYYSSMPILLLIVIGVGGALIYMLFTLDRIPIKVVLVIAGITAVTAWSLVKSLVVRGRDEDPGERIDMERHSALASVLREVAAKVGTRPIDNAYMTPGTEIAVMERGGMARQLRGNPERCLILGAGVLAGLSLGEFKSILAHEYGHFSNRDTAGGGFALAVRRSMQAMAQNLIAGDVARWYNPAWLFVLGFNRVFLRISQGASRLQEVMADRWAAIAYGSAAFVTGLCHVIENSVRFDLRSAATLKGVVDHREPLTNLYRQAPSDGGPDEEEIAKAIAAVLEAEPSPYDSHPSPADRMDWVDAMDAPGMEADGEDGDVWSLFSDREEVERRMTAQVRENMRQLYGIAIAAGPPAPQ